MPKAKVTIVVKRGMMEIIAENEEVEVTVLDFDDVYNMDDTQAKETIDDLDEGRLPRQVYTPNPEKAQEALDDWRAALHGVLKDYAEAR